jgi:ABC-type multidrug transport system ATPase subunit
MKLVIDGVSKQYAGKLWGLRDLRMDIARGVVGLLGPNGAGKSTLMRILTTVTRPTAGRVFWNDEDIAQRPDPLRSVLGYLPQDFGVYPHLKAREFLEYLAAAKGLDAQTARRRIDELRGVVNLGGARNRALGGRRRRAAWLYASRGFGRCCCGQRWAYAKAVTGPVSRSFPPRIQLRGSFRRCGAPVRCWL